MVTNFAKYANSNSSASMTDDYDNWRLYNYTPTRAGAVAFAVLFCISLIFLLYEMYYYSRKAAVMRKFSLKYKFRPENEILGLDVTLPISSKRILAKYVPLLAGCLLEMIGYAARAYSKSHPKSLPPFIVQSILLLIAPALMVATIYMLFGRMLILLRCTHLSIIPSRYGITIFVIGDIFSFVLQGLGGGLMADENETTTGSHIIVVGLFIQIAFFALFVINEVIFSYKVKFVCPPVTGCAVKTWKAFNLNLLICSILILLRSIVRVIEFIQGHNGYINSHEYFIYVFDAIPMLLTVSSFVISMPSSNLFKLESEC